MRIAAILLAALPLVAADTSVETAVRGQTLTLSLLTPGGPDRGVAVIFLPGDGGWRGAAVTMGRTIAGWGYEVYGFDTKKYLEAFSASGNKPSVRQLSEDVRFIAERVSNLSRKPVVLVGWSQGASMSIAAASAVKARMPIFGVVTLGLPETGVLGWDWKATLAVVAHRVPDQPAFAVKPLLPSASPVPVWMIHGTGDEYTTSEVARELFRATAEPKQMEEIAGANHRFDGHQDELYRSLGKGLAWIASK